MIHVVVTVNCACSSGRRVGESASKSCPTHSRACACELAAKGYNLFEPSGQDGRRCQWLAALDQAEREGCWSRGLLTIDDLEHSMLNWLRRHAADEVIVAAQGDCARFGRRDEGWDHGEVEELLSKRASAWGDHTPLSALLGFVYERFGLVACARIIRLDGSIDAVFTPDNEDDDVEVELQLAYTGNHYLSIVPLAECAKRCGGTCSRACIS